MYKVISRTFVFKGVNTLEPLKRSLIQRGLVKVDRETEKSRKVANLKWYWFGRYINYIKNYEHTLERKFPRTMQMYRVFSVGTRDVYTNLKSFVTAIKKQGSNGVDSLTREQLQLMHTMPRDLRKLLPLFLLSAAPFTNYIIFPLALYFPRYLLTSHYWTLQQKLEFMLSDHKARLKHNRPLFRCMQAELKSIKDETLRIKWRDVIACLGSGTHPTTKNIIACSKLFSGPPYSLNNLKRKHLKELLAIHGMSLWRPFKRKRLTERGMLILRMDRAIIREGGIKEMSNEAMRWALSFRGVNPANMSIESMRSWLEQWLIVSASVDQNNLSLLLHNPILLAYNHSTNWTLIYS
ncbi:PREDICTED: LETM1 domain-containing protein 1 [Trachymyrmex cornetzi]|uniref:LETM1 domain-containing protein 1 n=1 Tax=Trachymyrmex cornetzi TaxID=471704 RepID=A0A195DJ41_9HYME|nr:PREDICTED: LETM1 domain-containing protein 1 [Trachymyrmex cornetzi]XP_018372518.1 PREDICTED: LETM1 domain-containing protein 1 [Trachymyrmex cornetzi]KYN12519.1 LETM1 domain-containing protein 1 [Trachymyrmex cornetzi]